MTGSRGLSPHSALSPFPLETGTCTLDSVVECCKPIAYSHILAIIIFQVKIWSSSGSSRKTIAAPEQASASILTQTPIRGGALVLLGIFDPADGSSLQKSGDLNDCATCFAPRSNHRKSHVLQIIVPEKDALQVIDNEVDRPVAGVPELAVVAAARPSRVCHSIAPSLMSQTVRRMSAQINIPTNRVVERSPGAIKRSV